MEKNLSALGFMSGTSGDGVDTSVISSNGKDTINIKYNRFDPYPISLSNKIHRLKESISKMQDLLKYSSEIDKLELEITNFHIDIAIRVSKEVDYDLIGFHGHTIYHNTNERISKQIGLGTNLSKLTNKSVVYNFRQNDIKNGGEGAPLTPIFHQLLATQYKLDLPTCILNIGGISNITIVGEPSGTYSFTSRDIGPGNCLIDSWVRKNSELNFDRDGLLAAKGTRNDIIFEQAQELFANRPNQKSLSFDVNDFDVSFARGLSLEDGTTTLTDFTARIIGSALFSLLSNVNKKLWKVLVCGGGRKNHVLIEKIKKNTLKNIVIQPIDDYGIDGDFVESQAFGFLALRSILKLPISFPETTGCKKPSTGGEIIQFK